MTPLQRSEQVMNEVGGVATQESMDRSISSSLNSVEDVETDTASEGKHASLHCKCLYGSLRNESKHEGTGDCVEKYDNIGIMN